MMVQNQCSSKKSYLALFGTWKLGKKKKVVFSGRKMVVFLLEREA